MLLFIFSILCGSQRASQVHSSLDEVIRSEQHWDAPSFSLLPEDLMRRQVLSFLELREIVRLDSALANHTLRKYLHTSIVNTVLNGTIDFGHLNWCKARKCSAKTLRISSIQENDFPFHFNVLSPFEILEVCTTAKLSEHALHKLLSAGDFKILNIQSFYCMRPHHHLPFESDLSLLEINVSDNMNLREDVLIALVSRCPLLQTVNATAGIYFTERLPVALSKHCPQLRRVALYTTSDFGEDSDDDDLAEQQSTGYCELFQSCRQLQVVDCGGDFSLANMQTLADCCKELTSVALRHWGMVRWEETHTARAGVALTALVQNNPHIHSLRLYDFQCLTEASLCDVAQNLPALHTLYLDCRQPSLPGLASIRAICTKLTSFEVFRYRQVTIDTATTYLPVCILKTLHIYSTTLSDAQLLTIAQANPTITALTITSYISFQTNEQNLNVLSSNALCEAVSCLPHLEKFYAQQYPSRGRLREYAVQLEDRVLYALAQNCPSLTSVSITGHTNLSNKAISALSSLPHLRELNAKTCANILDSSIAVFAERCPLLENIDFFNCPHISSVGISALARYCRRLTNVALRRCRGIQNNDIQCLIRRARYLESLSIARNPQLTFAAVEELPLYCPCMRDVYFFINVHSVPQKPLFLEFYGAYWRNKHYFDVVFGWSVEHKVLFRTIPWDD